MMKKIIRNILCLLLLAVVLTACTQPAPKRSDREIIDKMISAYGAENHSPQKIAELLSELEKQNPEAGALWREIMDYWDYVNTGMPIRFDVAEDEPNIPGRVCIVVLGYQLEPEGTMKPELIGRLETAMFCAAYYPDAYILCTGGGTASMNREATEADCMAAWLAEQGITEDRIIVENRSVSTVENARFSHRILAERYPDVGAILIATSDYHIPWASSLFETEALLLGEGRPRVAGHVAYYTGKTNTYMSTQVAQMRDLAAQH